MTKFRAAVFDAYGTLLDVHSAMARHAEALGPAWAAISADWRAKQLEYSWIRGLAGPGQHRDFWQLTQEGLAWAAARHGVTDRGLLDAVLSAYRSLDAYPEVPEVLLGLRARGIARAILSNGEPSMLADATRTAGIDALLDGIFSIETVGVFKPHPSVYRIVVDRFGIPASQMAFISSNAWDAFGAHAAGFQVFWVNRLGLPEEYDLGRHARILRDLTGLTGEIA